ncbi:ABC1 kinase family protein [Thiomicrospira microaerophila]|uniref:ABC1 kinase family protein n=1 Tax=Thiomicrospira microaerophila TaxID=406020 RepID=UPI0005C8BE8E|nr:AarF/ABC1/UbiB kinase family protein [Thiomicrospira microaerophila]
MNNNQANLPSHRLSRLARLGKLASGVAGSMLYQGSKQWLKGETPNKQDLLLSPQNLQRFSQELAKLRGAAMKVGQLLSMDAGDLLPPELASLLANLRNQAPSMPLSQLQKQLAQHWGQNWSEQFTQFSFYPIAAASIGQVHRARNLEGYELAIKIQYPGVAQSISSDVDNLATLLSWSRLIPADVDLKPIIEEAKQQLLLEADYQHEAQAMAKIANNITQRGLEEKFAVPTCQPQHSNAQILAMSFMAGEPIEQLKHKPQAERDRAMSHLFELLFLELFDWQLVQTDPNFANFLYQPDTQRIGLLDFGATRKYNPAIAQGYRQLISGALEQNLGVMEQAAEQIGFFQKNILPEQKASVMQLFHQACEPLCQTGTFDFANSDLIARIKQKGMALSFEQNYWHSPPADALFFHRKLGGLYLLAAQLGARVNLQSLFEPYRISMV